MKNVHQLLGAGYSRLERALLRDQEEPAITGFLVKEIRSFIESAEAPSWAVRFSIHDDPPIDSPRAVGKSRPRVDIEMERVQPGPRPRFQFEAKRLYRKDSIGEYLGEAGLQNFLSGRYAGKHDDAGMIGYVQVQPVQDWTTKIQKRIEGSRKELFLKEQGDVWNSRADTYYSSFHLRPGRPIRIHHTFLECC